MQDTSAEPLPEPPGIPGSPGGEGSLAAQLRAAAIGAVAAPHYLSAFDRLERAGRTVPLWNWAAALALPAWLAFRGLWRWLGGSVAVAAGLAALLWAAYSQQWLPMAVLAGVAMALWLAAALALGLWGDALVYHDVQRRVEVAVAQSDTMQKAFQQLQDGAPGRGRMWVMAALLMVLVAAGVLAWLQYDALGAVERDGTVAVTGTVVGPVLSEPPRQAAVPPPVPVVLPDPDAAEAQAVQQETDAALAALAVQDRETTAQAAHKAKPEASQPKKRPEAARAAKGDEASPRPAASVRKLYINVGIFADPDNVHRVRERLRKEHLPVDVGSVRSAGGKALQRVRVGPFTSAAQANEAAAKVRLLGLDAVPAAQQE